jgi:hypothetical protein
VNLGNIVLLSLAVFFLDWNLSALPGQIPDRYFANRKGRYEQAMARLSVNLRNPTENFQLNVMLPPEYRSLSNARGGEVETSLGNNYNGTWQIYTALFYKANVFSWCVWWRLPPHTASPILLSLNQPVIT